MWPEVIQVAQGKHAQDRGDSGSLLFGHVLVDVLSRNHPLSQDGVELVHRSLVAEPPGGLVLDGMDEVHVPSDAKAHLTLGQFGLLALACA